MLDRTSSRKWNRMKITMNKIKCRNLTTHKSNNKIKMSSWMRMKSKKRKSSLKSLEKSRDISSCRGSLVDRSSKQLKFHSLRGSKEDSGMTTYSMRSVYQRKDYLKKVKENCKQTLSKYWLRSKSHWFKYL